MRTSPVLRHALVLACLATLTGCAGMNGGQEPPRITPRAATLPDGSVRVDTEDERLAALWVSAEEARRVDNTDAALAYLFEAIDLDPRNGLLWSRAAELQLDGGNPAEAESFAIKSNVYAGDNTTLLYRNWLMIEQARDMRGDLLGVRSAHKRVQQYQYR